MFCIHTYVVRAQSGENKQIDKGIEQMFGDRPGELKIHRSRVCIDLESWNALIVESIKDVWSCSCAKQPEEMTGE